MIYTRLTNQAMRIAYEAHHGQYDYNGLPYVFHPFHLAEQMKDEFSVCAALLHDVVEDTDVTIEELEAEFPKEVTEAVKLLTHDDSEDYFEYVRRLKTNPIARAVKLADLAHNQDESRFIDPDKISEKKRMHWREKYKKAQEIIEGKPVIRLAKEEDLPAVFEIYAIARKFMAENGNASQWGDSYPAESVIRSDLEKKELYVIEIDDQICGVFAFLAGKEPNYNRIEKGSWLLDTPYRTIHRVASSGAYKGVVSMCMDYCKTKCSHLRIDTHEDNHVMQHVLEKNGFQKCGIIYLENGSPRIGYEYCPK